MKTIEVGDVLYNADTKKEWRNMPTRKIVIERVTPTQAISKTGVKIKRTTAHDSYSEIGGTGWFYLPNDDSEEKYKIAQNRIKLHNERIALLRHAKNLKLDDLTTDQLTRIIKIVNEPK
jgi:hypothetical protein